MSRKAVLCFLVLVASVLADDSSSADLPSKYRTNLLSENQKYNNYFTDCPEDLTKATYFADPEDCGSFFECTNSGPVHLTCPEGTYYDTETIGCVWLENVDCGTRPTTPPPTTTVPTTLADD